MFIFDLAYKRLQRKKRGSNFMRRMLLHFADPTVTSSINNQKIKVPFSHMGIIYITWYPRYDRQLPIICSYIKDIKKQSISIVDVGANVGDTILCIGNRDAKYLAVEGVEKFYSLIPENLKEYDYILEKSFCGESEEKVSDVKFEKGTAIIATSNNNNTDNIVSVETLTNICNKYSFCPDFIKIDTDGFDFKVIRGSKDILTKYKPALYFEWTLPELLSNNENPISIFKELSDLKYCQGILLDNFGNPMMRFKTSDSRLLKDLIDYTSLKDSYYDVIVIHEESGLILDEIWNRLLRE